jgi:hypothetical protein
MDFPTPDAPETSNNMGYFFLSKTELSWTGQESGKKYCVMGRF